MKEKKEKVDIKKFKGNKETLNIKELMLKKNKEQEEYIKGIISNMYESEVEVTKKYIEKALDVLYSNTDTEIFLPYSLCVTKEGNKLIFSFKKNNVTALFIIFIIAFLLMAGFATYTGVQYLGKINMNIDLNGDGIADLNIDLDDNGICDINCDTDKDGKPDLNIDYRGNRQSLFNKAMSDGSIVNKINQDTDNDGICDLNCDTNGDGWPDTNLDLDGDGIPDINIDRDHDGVPELNIDTNGDMTPDINIDTDNDGICDKNCTYVANKDGQANVGEGDVDLATAALVVNYESGNNVVTENLYPDDQKGNVTTTVPDVKFTVQNQTNNTLYYDLYWGDIVNTFESNNFWVRVVSDNGGYNQNFATAPFSNGPLKERIAIAANTIQHYTVSFTLHGTGEEQNYDQGKLFKGKINVVLLDS